MARNMFTLVARRAPRWRDFSPTYGHTFISRKVHAHPSSRPGADLVAKHSASNSKAFATSSRCCRSAPSLESLKRGASGTPEVPKDEPPKPKTKAWYNRYLFKSLRRAHKPKCRYNSLEVDTVKSKLPSALLENPLKLFDSGLSVPADLDDAGRCLELYIARHIPKPDDQIARVRKHYVHDKPGSRALAWSLSLKASERKTLWGNISFTGPVTHCLFGKGNVDSLWHWMMLEPQMGSPGTIGWGNLRWKQDILRATIEAQVVWAEGTDCWADAIKTLIRANSTIYRISRQAALFLHKTMLAADTPTADPILYDQLTALVGRFSVGYKSFNLAYGLLRSAAPSPSKHSQFHQTTGDGPES